MIDTRALPLLLACIAIAVVAIHAIDSNRASVVLGGLRNAGHIPLFGLVSLIVLRLMRGTRRPLLNTVIGCLLIAGVAELSQFVFGGEPDWRDGFSDLIGIALFLSAARLATTHPVGAAKRGLMLLLIALSLAPMSYWLLQWGLKRAAAPCLTSSHWQWMSPLYRPDHASFSPSLRDPGQIVMTFDSQQYAGMTLTDPMTDWREFDYLALTVFAAAGSEGDLTLRVHDVRHSHEFSDRFNETLTLSTRPTTHRISLNDIRDAPANRRIDLAQIRELKVFRTSPRAGDQVIVGPICLHRGT
ncbi:MAG: hypothetical protein AAF270_01495 [Pseudomonadota bacterium]